MALERRVVIICLESVSLRLETMYDIHLTKPRSQHGASVNCPGWIGEERTERKLAERRRKDGRKDEKTGNGWDEDLEDG